MKWIVDWAPAALSVLATLWQSHKGLRKDITSAQTEIDRILGRDPLGGTVTLSEGLSALQRDPLRVLVEISEEDRTVRVVSVKLRPSNE